MKKILLSAIFVICIGIFGVLASFQRTLLKESGVYKLSILKNSVDVRMDEYGIPHIDAKNLNDAYKVLGYIMAKERLFQMDLLRRLINGSLSEVFGETTVSSDILLRRLRLKKTAEEYLDRNLENLDQKMIENLNSFLEGVHYFVEHDSLPIEFHLLGYTPEKFQLADIFGLSGYMALSFAEGLTGDILTSELMEKLPQEKMDVVRKGSDTDKDYFSQQKIVKNEFYKKLHSSLDKINEIVPLFHGSNSWVLSGERTVSGKPLLANDPHIATSNPHIFYEAHIKTPDLEVYGNFIPLAPFAVMGHTPYSAWGITMAEVDDLTIYSEKINPQDPDLVMYKNEWVPLNKYKEEIKIKGRDSKKIEVVLTPHGPLIDGTKYGIEGKNLSIHWSVYHPENNIVQSLFQMPRVRNVEEFKVAASYAGAPGLNLSWIHENGDIAWWVLGKFPKLPDGVPYDIVLNGWDGTNEIERYFSIDENPHQINPDSGVIVTANYKPQLEEFSHFDGYWQPAGRYFRIEKLLSEKVKWSIEDVKQLQNDDFVPIFEQVKSQLLKGLKKSELSGIEKTVLEKFKNWNGKSDRDSVGSSIYHAWNYYLLYNIFSDEMGDEGFHAFGKTAEFWHAFKNLLFNLDHPFWDNVKSDHVESGPQIITKSFKESVNFLKTKLGQQVSHWKWGRLHTVTYVHPVGKQKPLNWIYNIGPIQANGGRYTINNLGHRKSTNDFSVVHGPATRRIIDLGNPRRSYGVLPTGNSGNPLSPHFKDQLRIYHNGQYRLQNMDWNILNTYSLLKFVKSTD